MNIKSLVKRGTALVLSACFIATAFPPEEVKACGIETKGFINKISSNISYHNKLNKINRLVVPEKSGTTFGVRAFGVNANTAGSADNTGSSDEKVDVKLKAPEVTSEKDETEEKLEGAYGKPVEVSRNEKVYKVNKKSFVTYLTNDANTYINEDGKEVARISLKGNDGNEESFSIVIPASAMTKSKTEQAMFQSSAAPVTIIFITSAAPTLQSTAARAMTQLKMTA